MGLPYELSKSYINWAIEMYSGLHNKISKYLKGFRLIPHKVYPSKPREIISKTDEVEAIISSLDKHQKYIRI